MKLNVVFLVCLNEDCLCSCCSKTLKTIFQGKTLVFADVMMNNESDVELYEEIVGDLSYSFPPQTEVSSQLTNVLSPSVRAIFQGPPSNEDREMRELFAHDLRPALRHSSEL